MGDSDEPEFLTFGSEIALQIVPGDGKPNIGYVGTNRVGTNRLDSCYVNFLSGDADTVNFMPLKSCPLANSSPAEQVPI